MVRVDQSHVFSSQGLGLSSRGEPQLVKPRRGWKMRRAEKWAEDAKESKMERSLCGAAKRTTDRTRGDTVDTTQLGRTKRKKMGTVTTQGVADEGFTMVDE